MEKTTTGEKRDILSEDYKGTGAIISSLGYGVVESKIAMVPGAMLGGIAAATIPKSVTALDNAVKEVADMAAHSSASTLRKSVSWPIILWRDITNWAGNASIHVVDFFYKPFAKTSILSKIPAEQIANYSKGIAHGAGIGILIASVLGIWHGVSSSGKGENQFDRAKKEIKTLRDEKEALATELDNTGKELAKTKAEAHTHAAKHNEAPRSVISSAETEHHGHVKAHGQHHGHGKA